MRVNPTYIYVFASPNIYPYSAVELEGLIGAHLLVIFLAFIGNLSPPSLSKI